MQRREFNKGAVSAAVVSLFGLAACGGGGGGGGGGEASPAASGTNAGASAGSGAVGATPSGPATTPAPPAPPAATRLVALGTNFSGMEWARSNVRISPLLAPNVNFTVPRAADVAYMARNGFGRNRLPIQWEMLQPMLVDTPANAQARALIGEPGALNATYVEYITRVLDAHASVGARCIIDLHNYCRYRDFRFQADGSVIGLTRSNDPLAHAYTTDRSQVFERIFATAPGATLRPAAFVDVWTRMARLWKDHPGFGGYGLMNEPYDLPRPGGTTETSDGSEDLLIWPAFARPAIDAIRALDPAGTIYLSGNAFGGAMNIGPRYNPAWPLTGTNIVYEVHAYVDAWNSGTGFDYDLELQKDFVAGVGPSRLTQDAGVNRMRVSTDWARANNTRVALTETAMPIDDPRWAEAFRRLITHTVDNGWEAQTWMGGNHWPARNFAINHVPGWHQNKTLEPEVGGQLKAAAGLHLATLFDDGGGWSAGGAPVTITVYARGSLAAPATLTVASDGGGSFSKTTLTIPAGANGQDSFTFTPVANRVTILSYASSDPQVVGQLPPPRKVYSLADPVAHAATSLPEAAHAILARYSASKWELTDGFTDYLQGRPAGDGDTVRAVADTGFGSSVGNTMDMLNWFNQDGPNMGPLVPPTLRQSGPRKHSDHSAPGCTGFWCHKPVPTAAQPNPRNRMLYDLQDAHFVVAAVRAPAAGRSGVLFQASRPQTPWVAELAFDGGRPQARWVDINGQSVVLNAPAVAAGAPVVVALRSAQGAQQLRVNSAVAGTASANFAPSVFGQMLIGWGFTGEVPAPSFGGGVHTVMTGRGNPTVAEMGVLERYAASTAGIA
jgi:endoglucanase